MEEFLAKTFYLWGILLIVPIWAYIFVKRKSSRRELILVGTLVGIAAVLTGRFYAIDDYWLPPYIFGPNYNIEDFFYGFFFGGICGEIYETLVNKEDSKPIYKKKYDFLIFCGFILLISFLIIVDMLGYNSIYAFYVFPTIAGLRIIFKRNDLMKAAIMSGVIMTIFVIAWYLIILLILPSVIQKFWMTENLIGVYFYGIPIEEIIFGFTSGFGCANIYEFVTGRKIINSKYNLK